MSVQPRRLVQVSTHFQLTQSPIRYSFFVAMHMLNRFVIFCSLKINHTTDDHEHTFILWLLCSMDDNKYNENRVPINLISSLCS
jgi:hypothetical protein